ncbi:alcohol dehydrogenase [Neisseria dentiae]|uniref:Alcohol dehydrogenase n=1 Tax=Neisseria dentiae TaxID=194197 RepID=A0A1X3DG71_9NEIS|nr:iron-containing alcohol dehydrogenase [Neisseria dentiae]OSI18712.1 alcohol dehydrogenase [Neisseria dentiae]QMT46293.1 iron-containing alcohol dehydrogenase [Neisseria dentiae]STZ52497.1 Lactaldehyde reductase [Neisseria dentiae]
MSIQSIVLPRMMQIGSGACEKLPEFVRAVGGSKPLLVTDKMMVQLGYAEQVLSVLREAGIEADVYDDTVPEPTASSIMGGVVMVQNGSYDVVIALGGGSPIDSAKAIAVMGKFGGTIRDYCFPRLVSEKGLPLIAIPTTAGTGSECTKVTVITDEANSEKLLCVGTAFMPTAAIIDYTLSLSVPPRTTADTGIDALTHAIEAYVSRKAGLYSDSQALAAMSLIGPNLRTVYHDGGNRAAREAMMLGSTLAGIAFNNASVALVHGMSRPIGAFFHVPHGLSNAMLLPAVTAYSIPAAAERYADCARAIGVAAAGDDTDTANGKLLDELVALNRELKVPTLAEFGVQKADFDAVVETMAEQALASGSPGNNPRIPAKEEIVAIYRELW